ncbi:hypothetical protein DAEQUDRAFT_333853 [Daedalea quercina L-15889]|uniref:RING-type domain-containing protein n=1 Tax=Daedalea quercina L-15889 TaxID=1314783 RepID=A0A165PMY2_9APHY|nr:hypothetical protein DAEQUDRAFT_333853 [Daedalea quercina L-15889]
MPEVIEVDGLIGPKDVLYKLLYPVAPRSDACTFSRTTRAPSPMSSMSSACRRAASVGLFLEPEDAPSLSMERTSTSAESKTLSEEISSVAALASTTTGRSASTHPAPPESAPQSRPTGPSWHCRSCGKDPCENPTATQCGHIFCHGCIVKEIADKMGCPVCHKMFLLRLQVH